ncbi:MAG: hypothetical protein RL685_875 [Pseudomonadota bacterium]
MPSGLGRSGGEPFVLECRVSVDRNQPDPLRPYTSEPDAEREQQPGGGLCLWHLDLPRGAACDPEQGAYCNGSDGCLSSGICDQRRELGEACEVDNDCASLLCAEGVCTDPHGFSCAERICPSLWSCVDERCARTPRL